MIDLRKHHDDMWAALPDEVKTRALIAGRTLRDKMDPDDVEQVRTRIANDSGDGSWITPYHFYWGMAVRNFFRDFINDNELPSGNWDDYYAKAVEETFSGSHLL